MTNIYFDRLQRDPKFRKQEEVQPPTSDLGAAIEQLIKDAAAAAAEATVEKQKPLHNPAVPEHRRPFTDKVEQHSFPPPPPRTAPPRDLTVQLFRDETGRANRVTVGDMVFNVQRNQEGRVVRMVAEDIGDPTPVPPAPLNEV